MNNLLVVIWMQVQEHRSNSKQGRRSVIVHGQQLSACRQAAPNNYRPVGINLALWSSSYKTKTIQHAIVFFRQNNPLPYQKIYILMFKFLIMHEYQQNGHNFSLPTTSSTSIQSSWIHLPHTHCSQSLPVS